MKAIHLIMLLKNSQTGKDHTKAPAKFDTKPERNVARKLNTREVGRMRGHLEEPQSKGETS